MDLKGFGRLEMIIIILIAVSLAAKFALIPFNQGMWWDEAVYLGLGKGILEGRYSMWPGTTIESFRPLLFPVMISPISSSPIAVRFLVAAISALSVYLVYRLSVNVFGKRAALWAAFFMSTAYHFVFFSTKALSEMLFIFVFALSLLSMARWSGSGDRKHIVIAGILAGMLFVTRYLSTLIIMSYVIFLLYILMKRRGREVMIQFALFMVFLIMALLPWMLINLANYGDPVAGFSVNYLVYASSSESDIMPLLAGLGTAFGVVWLVMVPGVAFLLRNPKKNAGIKLLLSLLFLLPFVFYFISPHREPRYFLSFSPVYAIVR